MRPKSCRTVGSEPGVKYFKPRGIPLSELEEVILSVDELEAVRLADYGRLYQEEAAGMMNVSRPTFGRIIESAHRKIADALTHGKALKIEGGKVALAAKLTQREKGDKMNIAVSTSDGKTVCGHLGKCKSFIIFETEGGEVINRRLISSGGACPGHGEGSEGREHNVSPFEGCHAVITQGMGQGLLQGLARAGIQPVITEESDPDAAVMQFLSGKFSGTSISNCTCDGH